MKTKSNQELEEEGKGYNSEDCTIMEEELKTHTDDKK